METTGPTRAFGRWPSALRATGILIVVAVILGSLTSPAQQYLPSALASLANCAGVWFVAIVFAVRPGRAPLVLNVVLGIAGFLLLNVSYAVVSTARGFFYSAGFSNPWTIIAIPAGIAAGLAATWLQSPRRSVVRAGAAIPALVLAAEGIYGLTVVLATTGPVVWILELVGALAFVTWAWWRR